jgi:hypothetical protein
MYMTEEKTTIFMKISSWIKEKSSMNKFLFQKIHNHFHIQLEYLIILDIIFVFASMLLHSLFQQYQLWYWIPLLIISITLFALCRIIEIIIYQFHAILVSSEETVRDKGRIILLLIFNYVEIIFWYAFFYKISYSFFKAESQSFINDIPHSLYYSVVTITSLGDGGVKSNSLTVMFLIASEALIGLYITVIVIASFISVLTAKN